MAPLATVGILSIGDMGMGIAKLLIAKNYRVVTNLEGRRYDTSFVFHGRLIHRIDIAILVQAHITFR